MEVKRPENKPAKAQHEDVDFPAVLIERVFQLEQRFEGEGAGERPGEVDDGGEGAHFRWSPELLVWKDQTEKAVAQMLARCWNRQQTGGIEDWAFNCRH